jgi:hypothetical protein
MLLITGSKILLIIENVVDHGSKYRSNQFNIFCCVKLKNKKQKTSYRSKGYEYLLWFVINKYSITTINESTMKTLITP